MDDHESPAAAGSENFLEIWRRYERAVYAKCVGLLGAHGDEADEAFSRAAMQAYQRCPARFNDAEHAKAWLLALARNVCMDLHRERHRRREVSLEAILAAPVASASVAFVAAGDPERSLLAGERNAFLRASVRMLPVRLRVTVQLHYFHEMRYADIARRLGISEQNVRKRMQQARATLRRGVRSWPRVRKRPSPPVDRRSLRLVRVLTDRGVEREVPLVVDAADADPRQVARAEQYVARHRAGVSGRLTLARRLAAAGRFAEAIPHYEWVVRKRPYPPTGWLELGALLEGLDRISDASRAYAEGALRVGRAEDRRHLAARAAALQGRADAAIDALRSATETAPLSPLHFRALGEIRLRFGRPAAAAVALERAAALDPGDPLTALLLHDALTACGRMRAAERVAAAAALERHGDAGGLEADAEETLARYAARHPRNGAAWMRLARARLRAGHRQSACDAALSALRLEPNDRQVWLTVLDVLCAGTSDVAATRLVEHAAERFAGDSLLLAAAARVAEAQGRMSVAVDLYRQCVAADPAAGWLHLTLGAALFDLDREAARAELRAAWSALPPDDAHAAAAQTALLLAHDAWQHGDAEAAREWACRSLARLEKIHD